MNAPIRPGPGGAIGISSRSARRTSESGAVDVMLAVADEVPVALVYNGVSHAVMMASPADLADFALGFSLSEGILADATELLGIECVAAPPGLELRLTVPVGRFLALKERRRNLTGRSGCGLCGIEALAEAIRPLPDLPRGLRVEMSAIRRALTSLSAHQPANRLAGAVHAAAWADTAGRIIAAAEDIGRHNALDKLIGHLAALPGGRPSGFLLLTSRCSSELIAKAVTVGIEILVAISAPTGLALDLAERVGLGVVALARADSQTIYANAWRFEGTA
jgi:formate dehydrogenase accessory protein FdhD